MSLTFEKFESKLIELYEESTCILEDKDRFRRFSKNKDYVKENNAIYDLISATWFVESEINDAFSPSMLKDALEQLKKFIEKWETIPVSSWLFIDSSKNLKKRMEQIFDLISQNQIIKIYPWTSKGEVEQRFDELKKLYSHFPLRPEQYAGQFKIKALHEGGWKYSEITEFLRSGGESDREFAERMDKREKELKGQGKTEQEIEKILDDEFTFQEIDYDTVRKRGRAADEIFKKILPFFKIGR